MEEKNTETDRPPSVSFAQTATTRDPPGPTTTTRSSSTATVVVEDPQETESTPKMRRPQLFSTKNESLAQFSLFTGERIDPQESKRQVTEVQSSIPQPKWRKLIPGLRKKEKDDGAGSTHQNLDVHGAITGAENLLEAANEEIVYRVGTASNAALSWTREVQEYIATRINDYLRWTFKASFRRVILTIFLTYILFIVAFAIPIWGGGKTNPDCFSPEFEEGYFFIDAFQLSWTTFSTVGYGATGPGVGDVKRHCLVLNAFLAFQAFVGVLFGGVTGAVIFAKIVRVQSVASTSFSVPICVRYGTGLLPVPTEGTSEMPSRDVAPEAYPCPILEFRILNDLANDISGEILDAKVNVVASTIAEIEEGVRRKKSPSASKGLFGAKANISKATGSALHRLGKQLATPPIKEESPLNDEKPFSSLRLSAKTEEKVLRQLQASVSKRNLFQSSVTVDEGGGNLVPRQIFHKLAIDTDSHPFFKRVWVIRHVLDSSSPLLTEEARNKIDQNGGCWPAELGNYTGVRSNLNFHQIMVSFTGTANASGCAVYSQKVYDYADTNIGYAFAAMSTRSDEQLLVDRALLNDIIEQNGGGGEPLGVVDAINEDPIEESVLETADVVDVES